MHLNHHQTVKYILNYSGDIAIWGLSTITKRSIKKIIKNKIKYIIDIDKQLEYSSFKNIPIINPENINFKKKLLIIIWGSHSKHIVKYLHSQKHYNYVVDYTLSKNFIPVNLTIEIDKLSKNSNLNDLNYIFSKKISDYIYQQSCKLLIKPFLCSWNENAKPQKVLKKCFSDSQNIKNKTLIISYHTIGSPNKQILRWKEGYLQGMVTFDTRGYSGWSSLCEKNISKQLHKISEKKANNTFNFLAKKYIDNNISKYIQPSTEKFQFPNKFIFFPLQTINDTVMIHSYIKPIYLIKKIINILWKQNISLVIKQHPRCNNKELKELLIKYEKKNKIILYNGSIHDAISKAETVYTINSGVGFESLLHLKPVITFGKSDYMSMTKNINNLDTIKKEPLYYLNKNEKLKIKKFLHYYIGEKCLFLDDEKKLQRIVKNFIANYLNMKEIND